MRINLDTDHDSHMHVRADVGVNLTNSRLGIRARLLLIVITTILLFATAIFVTFLVLGDVATTYQRLIDVDERLLLDATRLRLLAEREVTVAQSLSDAQAIEQLRGLNVAQEQLLKELDDLTTDSADIARLSRIHRANDSYDLLVTRAVDLLNAGQTEEAHAFIMFGTESAESEFLASCDAFIVAKSASRDASRAAANQRLSIAGAGLLTVLLVGATLAAVVALALGGRIARGILQTAESVRRIARGDLVSSVRVQGDGELKNLAIDVEALRLSLIRAEEAQVLHRSRVQLVRDLGRSLLLATDLSSALRLFANRVTDALSATGATATLIDARSGGVLESASVGHPEPREADATAIYSSFDGGMRGELAIWRHGERSLLADEWDLLDALAAEAGLVLTNAALAEVAKRRADELDGFVNVVAHDVRGPVVLAQRLAELIRSRNPILAATEAPLFARMGDATAYAEGLIDDLREVVRVGRVPVERSAVAIDEVLIEVAEALAPLLAESAVHLETQVDLPTLMVNRRQLRQLLTNLIENAARHMGNPPGGPANVWIEAICGVGWYRISVLDNGRGIPSEERSRLFLPFQRMSSDTDNGSGMGIGLAIARRIVEAHGGTIWIDDSPGGGCAIWFTLPSAKFQSDAEQNVARRATHSQLPSTTPHD